MLVTNDLGFERLLASNWKCFFFKLFDGRDAYNWVRNSCTLYMYWKTPYLATDIEPGAKIKLSGLVALTECLNFENLVEYYCVAPMISDLLWDLRSDNKVIYLIFINYLFDSKIFIEVVIYHQFLASIHIKVTLKNL